LEGEDSLRPLLENLGQEAVESVLSGEVPIGADYQLAEADLAVLRTRIEEPGRLERAIAAHIDGVDGWVDDSMALIGPWGFDPTTITVPVSIWYGPDDSLCPRAHAEWLLAHIPGAERRELPSGHVLEGEDLDAIHAWLLLGP
jgi:pimeloyl-ACP methyl ester carboxylesterase